MEQPNVPDHHPQLVTGPTSDQAGNGIYPVQSFPVNIHVQEGQELAIDTSNNQAE